MKLTTNEPRAAFGRNQLVLNYEIRETRERANNSGIKHNLDTFHQSITNGIYENPTVEPSVNATLACILGREAVGRKTELTWDELIRDNRKIEVDLTGLKA